MKPTRFDIHAKLIFKVGSIIPNIDEIKSCVEAVREIDKRDDGMFVLHSDYVTLKKQTEWLPIETAPKDGTPIIGYEHSDSIYGGVTGIQWIPQTTKMFNGNEIKLGGYWGKSVHTQVLMTPSHWMPLPPLPPQ